MTRSQRPAAKAPQGLGRARRRTQPPCARAPPRRVPPAPRSGSPASPAQARHARRRRLRVPRPKVARQRDARRGGSAVARPRQQGDTGWSGARRSLSFFPVCCKLISHAHSAGPPPRHGLVRFGTRRRAPQRAPRHLLAPRLDHHGDDGRRDRDEPDRRRRRASHLYAVVCARRRHHLVPPRLAPPIAPHACVSRLTAFVPRSTSLTLSRCLNTSCRLHHLPPRVGVAARRDRACAPRGRRPSQALAYRQAPLRAAHGLVGLVLGRHRCRRPPRVILVDRLSFSALPVVQCASSPVHIASRIVVHSHF